MVTSSNHETSLLLLVLVSFTQKLYIQNIPLRLPIYIFIYISISIWNNLNIYLYFLFCPMTQNVYICTIKCKQPQKTLQYINIRNFPTLNTSGVSKGQKRHINCAYPCYSKNKLPAITGLHKLFVNCERPDAINTSNIKRGNCIKHIFSSSAHLLLPLVVLHILVDTNYITFV